jgi:predicted SAM-dependent methyltransferase
MSEQTAAYVLNPRWSSMEELVAAHCDAGLRLDLGCGFVKPEGFIGLDDLTGSSVQIADEDNAPDIFMDLNHERLPFPDSSCLEVRSSHFLEHSNLPHVLEESHRVLQAGGIFLFAVPYANSAEGLYPGHLIFLTEKWFRENLNFAAKFEIVKETFTPSDDFQALPAIVRRLLPFDLARKFLFNVCNQMIIEARACK